MSAAAPPRLRPFAAADRDWVAAAHSAHYRGAEGFDAGFDAAVAAALDGVLAGLGRDRTAGLMLEAAEGRCGCLMLCDEGAETARLRLFLLAPARRGQGLGRRLLDAALAQARAAGFRRVVVSTFDRHAAACRLYRAAGFHETGRGPRHAFGQHLVQRDFARDAGG